MNDDDWVGVFFLIMLSWWCPALLVFSVWDLGDH
jgi:hypothetical protein